MPGDKLRAWWSHRQGLDGHLKGQGTASVLAASGWARSVGGSSPYLTCFSRALLKRHVVDADLEALRVFELPSARGCLYLVPAEHVPCALTLGTVASEAEMRVARRLGVTDEEIQKLADEIKSLLREDTLSPDELRLRLGPAARSLGPDGKRKGVSTTIPLALGSLQAAGEIHRVPVNGRLDQQRYRYKLWQGSPVKNRLPLGQAQIELARLYFKWIGPATLTEFQGFSGFSLKAAKAATAPLELVPAESDTDRLLHPADLDSWKNFQIPLDPQFRLVSSLDGISLLRRDVKGLLADCDLNKPTLSSRNQPMTTGSLSELLLNPILDRGRIVGFWEFDPTELDLVYSSFVGTPSELLTAINATRKFICDELGDFRSFGLDSPSSRRPRIEFLRKESTL